MTSGLMSHASWHATDTSEVGVCFHGIGKPERGLEAGESNYWISEERFIDILDEVATWPHCHISFDDGNSSDYNIGLPHLQARGLTATFFPIAGRLGMQGSLDGPQLRVMLDAGMRVGSHGWNHVPWTSLSNEQLHRELIDAPRCIAKACGGEVVEAALPQGRYNRQVLAAARSAGIDRLFTSDRRVHRPGEWMSPRFSVTRVDDGRTFRAAVTATARPGRRLILEARGLVKRSL